MTDETNTEAKAENTPPAGPDPKVVEKLRAVTGLVNMEGKVTWAQLQLLEKIADPLAKELVQIIHATDPTKRIWDRLLKKVKGA